MLYDDAAVLLFRYGVNKKSIVTMAVWQVAGY